MKKVSLLLFCVCGTLFAVKREDSLDDKVVSVFLGNPADFVSKTDIMNTRSIFKRIQMKRKRNGFKLAALRAMQGILEDPENATQEDFEKLLGCVFDPQAVTRQQVRQEVEMLNFSDKKSLGELLRQVIYPLRSWYLKASSEFGVHRFTVPSRLNFSRKDMKYLTPGCFPNILERLKYINLSGNRLETLPMGAFQALLHLDSLDLSSNNIESLSEGAFDGLGRLRLLDLSWNKLNILPEAMFKKLVCLRSLYLSGNALKTLSKDAFDGLESLTSLSLCRNHLETLSEDAFDGLKSLTFLSLSWNELAILPEEIFKKLVCLTSLDLSGNALKTVSKDAFDGLESLTSLNLSRNDLETLPEGVFDGLKSLTSLNLSRNDLETLPEGAFNGLWRLMSLDLSWNKLNILPEEIFKNLIYLTFLDLSHNKLQSLYAVECWAEKMTLLSNQKKMHPGFYFYDQVLDYSDRVVYVNQNDFKFSLKLFQALLTIKKDVNLHYDGPNISARTTQDEAYKDAKESGVNTELVDGLTVYEVPDVKMSGGQALTALDTLWKKANTTNPEDPETYLEPVAVDPSYKFHNPEVFWKKQWTKLRLCIKTLWDIREDAFDKSYWVPMPQQKPMLKRNIAYILQHMAKEEVTSKNLVALLSQLLEALKCPAGQYEPTLAMALGLSAPTMIPESFEEKIWFYLGMYKAEVFMHTILDSDRDNDQNVHFLSHYRFQLAYILNLPGKDFPDAFSVKHENSIFQGNPWSVVKVFYAYFMPEQLIQWLKHRIQEGVLNKGEAMGYIYQEGQKFGPDETLTADPISIDTASEITDIGYKAILMKASILLEKA